MQDDKAWYFGAQSICATDLFSSGLDDRGSNVPSPFYFYFCFTNLKVKKKLKYTYILYFYIIMEIVCTTLRSKLTSRH